MANDEDARTDYTAGNSNKAKAAGEADEKPEKVVEQVVTSKVVVKKKGIGSRLMNIVAEADIPGVIHNVTYDFLIPAARHMIADGLIEGINGVFHKGERMRGRSSMYGGYSSAGPRITYNDPVRRHDSPISRHSAPPRSHTLGSRGRHIREEYILSSRSEGELVLERLRDIIDVYGVASVFDLKELMGLESNHVDQKWGWVGIIDASVVAIRDGFILDLPPEEALQ